VANYKITLHIFLFALAVSGLAAQENKYRPDGSQIPGPASPPSQPGWVTEMEGWTREQPSEFKNWLSDIQAWRTERLVRIGYDDAQYRRPEFQWAQRNFIAPPGNDRRAIPL
jgi:iron(II)-dependent oxidoreductase